jgi:hypothetical protein
MADAKISELPSAVPASGDQFPFVRAGVTSRAGVYDTTFVGPTTDTNLILRTNNTEKARITSAGNVGIGMDNPTSKLHVTGSITAVNSTGSVVVDSARTGTLGDGEFAFFNAESGSRFAQNGIYKHSGISNPVAFWFMTEEDGDGQWLWVDNSGNLRISTNSEHPGTTSGTVIGTQTSDERLKNLLGQLDYGLDSVMQLAPVKYAMKSDPDQTPRLGFLAQQVNPIIPEAVFDTDEEIEEGEPTKLGMEYVALIPVLVKAIQEQQALIKSLTSRIEALESE